MFWHLPVSFFLLRGIGCTCFCMYTTCIVLYKALLDQIKVKKFFRLDYCVSHTSQIYEGVSDHFLHIFHFFSGLEVFFNLKPM